MFRIYIYIRDYTIQLYSGIIISHYKDPYSPTSTVDGRNPAPVDMVNVPIFTWFSTSQVVQGVFHQQWFWSLLKCQPSQVAVCSAIVAWQTISRASSAFERQRHQEMTGDDCGDGRNGFPMDFCVLDVFFLGKVRFSVVILLGCVFCNCNYKKWNRDEFEEMKEFLMLSVLFFLLVDLEVFWNILKLWEKFEGTACIEQKESGNHFVCSEYLKVKIEGNRYQKAD